MTDPNCPQNSDTDIQGSYTALLRAAQKVRDEARETGMPLVYWRNGRVIYEYLAKDSKDGPGGLSFYLLSEPVCWRRRTSDSS